MLEVVHDDQFVYREKPAIGSERTRVESQISEEAGPLQSRGRTRPTICGLVKGHLLTNKVTIKTCHNARISVTRMNTKH